VIKRRSVLSRFFWSPEMGAVPRRLKRIEVYCPEYKTTATIRINDAHSSGTDHLEVDYRSPDHSHFTIAIPDDWTDQDLLDADVTQCPLLTQSGHPSVLRLMSHTGAASAC
jgi:hypothetical protein